MLALTRRVKLHVDQPISNCCNCPVGTADHPDGGSCPFVDRTRRAGELIFLQGDPAERVWFVKSGTVLLLRQGSEDLGEGRVRAVRFVGSFIGLESLVDDAYNDTARASTDAVLCGITRDKLDSWLGPPQAPARVALELSLRADSTDLPRLAQTDGSAVSRVAAWLNTEGPRGVTLTLPRKVVADLLGMRPETLSRALATLAQREAIAVSRNNLRILDDDKLREAAGVV